MIINRTGPAVYKYRHAAPQQIASPVIFMKAFFPVNPLASQIIDGIHRETPGVSFLTLDDNCQICRQFDMFDLAHQMALCDELEGRA